MIQKSVLLTENEAQEAFRWRPEDLADLADLQVILAADIIYDDDLTEAFMTCMESFLMPDPSRDRKSVV